MNMKTVILIILVLVVLAFGTYFLMHGSGTTAQSGLSTAPATTASSHTWG